MPFIHLSGSNMHYNAPLKELYFIITELAPLSKLNQLPGYEEATSETAEFILEEHARFCKEVIAPLNPIGDQKPSYYDNGSVYTSPGFKKAYQQYIEAGWQSLQHPTQFQGQGLPKLIATACMEMLNSANLSFALCPLLTDGTIEALMVAGSDEQKNNYLPHLVSGNWSGTMNLTEPQAGSDLAAVRTQATPQTDGHYKITGTKIFITYGEHDMSDNIIHLVLARTPNAPEGVKGLSLFIVPKLINGIKNDVQCVSLEHKLGIKASPTAMLSFGSKEGAIGYRVGQENQGLEIMFIMMNAARFAVGIQGLAIAQRAYDCAAAYARERIQSKPIGNAPKNSPILAHPDVRRMLMEMKAQIEAARSLAYVAAAACDVAHHHSDPNIQKEQFALYEYLVPIIKGWSTELAQDVTSTTIQVYGGMGYIEETGVAQYFRDARILTIYEGTTAIQANDLIGRKTIKDQGKVAYGIVQQIRNTINDMTPLVTKTHAPWQRIQEQLTNAATSLEHVITHIIQHDNPRIIFAAAVPYLKLAGIVLSGWQLIRAALIAEDKLNSTKDKNFYQAKIITTEFYATHILPKAQYYETIILKGMETVLTFPDDAF
jgi:butyryl-CoA dehydrogenase